MQQGKVSLGVSASTMRRRGFNEMQHQNTNSHLSCLKPNQNKKQTRTG